MPQIKTWMTDPLIPPINRENERELFRHGLDNHMRMMVDTGAKGSKVSGY